MAHTFFLQYDSNIYKTLTLIFKQYLDNHQMLISTTNNNITYCITENNV